MESKLLDYSRMALRFFRTFSTAKNDLKSKYKEFTMIKRLSQKELDEFSKLTNDFNPLHSKETPLEERKVHGAFLNAIVSGVMGSFMPGPGTIVLEQNLKFLKACRVDVDIEISVRLLKERKISIAEYFCRQNNDVVMQGEAKLLLRDVS